MGMTLISRFVGKNGKKSVQKIIELRSDLKCGIFWTLGGGISPSGEQSEAFVEG